VGRALHPLRRVRGKNDGEVGRSLTGAPANATAGPTATNAGLKAKLLICSGLYVAAMPVDTGIRAYFWAVCSSYFFFSA